MGKPRCHDGYQHSCHIRAYQHCAARETVSCNSLHDIDCLSLPALPPPHPGTPYPRTSVGRGLSRVGQGRGNESNGSVSMHYLRRGNCFPCTIIAVTAESTRFLVMGHPVASTTPSRATTYMHVWRCNMQQLFTARHNLGPGCQHENNALTTLCNIVGMYNQHA